MQLRGQAKHLVLGLALLALPLTLFGCGKTTSATSSSSSAGYSPKQLTVEFVPSQNAGTLEAKAKPLEGLLKKQLGIPVKVSVSTDYNTIVEAMGSKKVDVGFLPPDAYVLAHKQYKDKVLLQAQRYGLKEPNDQTTKQLVNYYRSEILVRKDSGIKNLKDLKGKKIAVQDTTSTSGWIFPAVEMLEHGVNINKDHIKTVQVKGHDQGALSVYNKNTDAAFVFQGARAIVKKDAKDIYQKLTPIYTTGKIPNDTITVRGDMNAKWQQKVANAFKAIAKTKKGHAIISSVYSHEGYVDSKDSNFDIIRQYDKKAAELNK
ncbi:phosphate/phosphite/phosphonate ABC transporter substrate-binding protein [Levilactobacillus suantsaii]|uniref:Phosphate/phosphite/phosphonate ABC transporter substrate-binding protein n=1 Tax=Levilactobacillus suantsaii TaxID=2292255 RepID=A0A4Q0VI77_9LACO|nr:phosphate/phosphite/phosphonate ABC transporter substrate-binding protein [Levilactobacillus suantsaii]QMU08870.1 phosphate/phosphite/phosphonate ABC transporter substrate-binding protein [Levilactobacillus suantsaii]RXI78123.1 phosphate/phosphite/phosphonate ABC transporter substrate-binding protein [Levilactobacillus suantsaii]